MDTQDVQINYPSLPTGCLPKPSAVMPETINLQRALQITIYPQYVPKIPSIHPKPPFEPYFIDPQMAFQEPPTLPRHSQLPLAWPPPAPQIDFNSHLLYLQIMFHDPYTHCQTTFQQSLSLSHKLPATQRVIPQLHFKLLSNTVSTFKPHSIDPDSIPKSTPNSPQLYLQVTTNLLSVVTELNPQNHTPVAQPPFYF